MLRPPGHRSAGLDQRVVAAIAVLLAVAVFLFTWFSLHKSREDSLALLEAQGRAFTEALAQASQNAIAAETYYDDFVRERYSDLVRTVQERKISALTEQEWVNFTLGHDLLGAYLFDSSAQLVIGVAARGAAAPLPDFVLTEVAALLRNPEANYTLLSDEDTPSGRTVHYYLELTSRMDHVVVLAADAVYYADALRKTGIGYLVQEMGGEPGIEYIVYQATDGIVFASRRTGELLAIESDPFLTAALESDTVMTRLTEFQGTNVLELVRPFASERFKFGLFRVGLSLEGYYEVSRGFDRQVIILSVTLFVLVLVALMYLAVRRKRQELSRRYEDIKSVTDRIFDQMRTGVAAVDSSGVIRLANRAFESIFGVERTVGRSWNDAVPDRADLLNLFAAGSAAADETELAARVGDETRTLLLARSRIDGAESEAPSVVMVAYDITRFREFEKQALRKQRLSEMGDLAAGVAHEIRNPLNAISIAAQRLASEFAPSENRPQYEAMTEQIRVETRRLNDIITRFLALARVDRKPAEEVRLDEVLRKVGEFLAVEGEKIGLAVKIDAASDLPLRADPARMRELFLNLFNNTKEALDGRPGEFSIVARRGDDGIKITVSDTGPGIPPELQDKVFAPYYTTKEAGTGLGLATVQRIVSELDGEISLESSSGTGARFVIQLPA